MGSSLDLMSAEMRTYATTGAGGPPPGIERAPRGSYQLRVPDPQNWKLDTLKDGNHGFSKWRKSFDLQVNAVWNGLGDILEEMRNDEQPIDETSYDHYILKHNPKPVGCGELDWMYKYVSN